MKLSCQNSLPLGVYMCVFYFSGNWMNISTNGFVERYIFRKVTMSRQFFIFNDFFKIQNTKVQLNKDRS